MDKKNPEESNPDHTKNWLYEKKKLRDTRIRSIHEMEELKRAQEMRVDELSVYKLRWRIAHLMTSHATATAEATTQCTSWRTDGSPPCLGITRVGPGQHPQYTRADYGQEAVGGSQPHKHNKYRKTIPNKNSVIMVAEQVWIQGESAEVACCLLRDEKTRPRWKHTAKTMRISPVHQCRNLDSYRLHTSDVKTLRIVVLV